MVLEVLVLASTLTFTDGGRGSDSQCAASSRSDATSVTVVGPTRSLPCNAPLKNTSGSISYELEPGLCTRES